MQVQVDTREHAKEWERIKGQFDALGVQYFRSKMYVGDYQSLDNPRLVIDRKRTCRRYVVMSASNTNVLRLNCFLQRSRDKIGYPLRAWSGHKEP